METLYELLGALPRDEAEDLRKAFRRAVKGAHPDLRPGDPDAGLKFRQIVRANEILGDPEQRAAYDHLLTLAQIERKRALARPMAAKIHKVASGMMAVASVSLVTVGGYLVFTNVPIPMALIAPSGHAASAHNPEGNTDLTSRVSASIAAVSVAAAPDAAAVSALLKGSAPPADPPAVIVASVDRPAESESVPEPVTITLPEVAPAYATLFRASRISFDYSGNLDRAAADLDQAIDLDPRLLVSYAEQGIPFAHAEKSDHVFADVTVTKRVDKAPHARSVVSASSSHGDAAALRKLVPLPVPRPRVPLRIVTHHLHTAVTPHAYTSVTPYPYPPVPPLSYAFVGTFQ